jgi:DNA mismatch repair protein MutS
VGRGTGTLDGLSIAHAVCDDLLERIRCRTLFATHYHELAGIQSDALANRSLAADECDGRIVFRRRLVEGPSADSYGLQVARLAGLPPSVLERAAVYLKELKEKGAAGASGEARTEGAEQGAAEEVDPFHRRILEELAALDVDNMTPLGAIALVSRWKAALAAGAGGNADRKRKAKKAAAAPPRPLPPPKKSDPWLFD